LDRILGEDENWHQSQQTRQKSSFHRATSRRG
jgi:hypothetical protein